MPLNDLIPTLQFSIGPVILISGIGLVLLSMTNRFGRVVDGTRLLTGRLKDATDAEQRRIYTQLKILAKRARIVRAGIALAAVSVFLAALLIISLFIGVLLQLEIAFFVAACVVWLFLFCSTYSISTSL